MKTLILTDEQYEAAIEALMFQAHEQEAERIGATFYNMGWGGTDRDIASKTDKGILCTMVIENAQLETVSFEHQLS